MSVIWEKQEYDLPVRSSFSLRLAAYELSCVVDEVPVRFVDEEAVLSDAFKLTNADDGRSMIIQLEESHLAFIVTK